jgi:hypothetical protein
MTSRGVLTSLGLLGVAIAGAGLLLNVNGFLGNALAGLSSLILGAVLAVVLIEQLLRQRRPEQWHLVRDEIRRAICEGVVDMASSFAIAVSDGSGFLGLVGPEDDPVARPQIAAALEKLIAATEAKAAELAAQLEPDQASSRILYDQIAAAVVPLRMATTTRVIVLGDEPLLVAALLTLERTEQRWGGWVETVEKSGAPDLMAWQQATSTLQAGTDVYKYFVRRHEVHEVPCESIEPDRIQRRQAQNACK